MTHGIEIRQLVHFLRLSEHASLSAAAEAMGLAQPSLGASISKLERQLGVTLILRSSRGVELTAAGLALAKEARQLRSALDLLVDRVRHAGGGAGESIRIALVPAIAQVLTVPLVETIQIEHPEIRLQITQGMSSQILQMIQEDRADIGCFYEIANPKDVIAQPLMTEELFLVTAPDNWPGQIDPRTGMFPPVTVEELAGLPLVLSSNLHSARNTIIERYFERRGLRLNVVMQIDALPQIVEVVERASAYSILPQAGVIEKLAAGRVALVPIADTQMTRTAYLARNRSKPVNSGTLAVLSILSKVTDETIRRFGLAATFHPSD